MFPSFCSAREGNPTDRQLHSAPNTLAITEVRAFSQHLVDDEILYPILPFDTPTRHDFETRWVSVMMPIQVTATPISGRPACIESTLRVSLGVIRYPFSGSKWERSSR